MTTRRWTVLFQLWLLYWPLFVACCASSGCVSHAARNDGTAVGTDRKAVEVARVIDAIARVKPWGQADEYTRTDWLTLLDAAEVIQETTPAYVAEGIGVYQWKVADLRRGRSIDVDARIFILLRTAFDVPEMVPEEQRPIWIGWLNWPEPDANGFVSVAWPLSWDSGTPCFVDELVGSMGAGYGGREEYGAFVVKYPYRDLETVRKTIRQASGDLSPFCHEEVDAERCGHDSQ